MGHLGRLGYLGHFFFRLIYPTEATMEARSKTRFSARPSPQGALYAL